MALPTPSQPRNIDRLSTQISVFESETYSVIQETSPRVQNVILYVVVALISVAITLMSVVPIDKVVSSSGKLRPEGGALFVQPLDPAIVSAILVHPGDVVRKGQTLATLDPTLATADFKQLEEKRASAAALVDRLEAEQAGRIYQARDPKNSDEQLQASIALQRRGEVQQAINDFDAKIASSESIQRKAEQDAENDSQHLALTSQLADMQQTLTQKGWGSKSLVLTATDNRVIAQRQLEESRNTAVQAAHDVASLRAQKADYINKWKGDLGVALVTARNDLNEATQSFVKASKLHDLDRLVAPEDAVVLSIGNASVGSVVEPATSQTPLFTLTPLTDPLVAEIDVDARDVGFIRKGDKVRLKIDAFTYTRHGVAQGVIKSISDGSFTVSDAGQTRPPYYKVEVAVTDARLNNVPKDFRLIPGMTVTGDVLIGGRTIMSYLIEGGLRTGSEAMREP